MNASALLALTFRALLLGFDLPGVGEGVEILHRPKRKGMYTTGSGPWLAHGPIQHSCLDFPRRSFDSDSRQKVRLLETYSNGYLRKVIDASQSPLD